MKEVTEVGLGGKGLYPSWGNSGTFNLISYGSKTPTSKNFRLSNCPVGSHTGETDVCVFYYVVGVSCLVNRVRFNTRVFSHKPLQFLV